MHKPHAFSLKLLTLLMLSPLSIWAQPTTAPQYVEPRSAADVWSDMTEAGVNEHTRRTYVRDAAGPANAEGMAPDAGRYVMFGGEKEGSSGLITRVMGPTGDSMKSFAANLGEAERKQFMTELLSGFASGKYRVRDVRSAAGEVKAIDLEGLRGQNFSAMSLEQLTEKYNLLMDRGGEKVFSFLTPQTRMKLFKGNFPGLSAQVNLRQNIYYGHYRPLWGDPEKYIDAAHGTSQGWEINFIPQRSYGEFEHMISWFKNALKNAGQLFEAPGHQWIVYPKTQQMMTDTNHARQVIDRVQEIHKNNQAYIVLRALEGDAGIEFSSHKSVHTQDTWMSGLDGADPVRAHDTGRGVIRLENNRFQVDSADSLAVEFRAGTKNDNIRRRTQQFLISRYAAQDFEGIAPASSWSLNQGYGSRSADEIVRRFGVTQEEAEKFLQQISSISRTRGTRTKAFNSAYLVPLWNWEEAPYLSAAKKAELRQLTQAFIKTVNGLRSPSARSVSEAMRSWSATSRLSTDIENYLRPRPQVSGATAAAQIDLPSNARVNVNEVDVGIEYTARFPAKTSAQFTRIPNQPGKMEWLRTSYEYSREERREVLRRAAQSIAKDQNRGRFTAVSLVSGGDGHGHGLDVAYEFRDAQNRKWRVEWDGIGRSYDTAGNMIPESLRGGHIEIVTPKFNPTAQEMQGVFRSLQRESLIPAPRFGGGHVNIDLAPFEGKPKALARFLGTYYDNRNTMTLLFQHPGRGVGAEPNRVSQSLIDRLKTFDGTEEELKQLLYNERFFNTRVGRKTKNNQLNLIAYFQDVIPQDFIHEDFDMKNDMWRRTFDVDPRIRKMEFRMFNAPRNAAESALQIKFVRAMMNKALNEDTPVFRGNYEVNTGALAQNPQRAEQEFLRTMNDLHLDPAEYRGFYTEGLALNRSYINNPNALSNEQKLALHPEVQDWGRAVEARTVPLPSAGRHWAGNDVLPEARAWRQSQLTARQTAERARAITPAIEGTVSKLTITGGDSIVNGNRCRTAASVVEDLLD